MKYILYKTINTVNDRYYIGVHRVNGSGYLGSGKLLKKAIKKYGRKVFIRKTLKLFDVGIDAYNYEAEIVNEKLIADPLCYNMAFGGCGGAVCGSGKNHPLYRTKISENQRQQMILRGNGREGTTHTEETKRKISKSNKGKLKSKAHCINIRKAKLGKKLSKSHKLSIQNANRTTIWVINNKQFGSCREAQKSLKIGHATLVKWCNDFQRPDCYKINKKVIKTND